MTAKTAARTRRAAATVVTKAATSRTRKATTSKAADESEPKLYTIHSLDEVEIDTRVRRVDPLDKDGARQLTEQIQRTQTRLWLLVTEAHDRKAHLALGYETWADYVKAELNMSESRSYQYLDTGHVMKAIASAGVDVETMAPPPTRVVARVKDRLTDVRKAAEKAVKQGNGDGHHEADVAQAVRALANEPRKTAPGAPRGRAAAQAAEARTAAAKATSARASSGKEPEKNGDTVTCPACGGTGRIEKSLAELVKDLMGKVRSG